MSERIPTPENNLEPQIIKTLKDKGPDSPEAKELLARWIAEEERKADNINIAQGRIQLDRKRARLYLQAGYRSEAFESLESALAQAANEGDPDLWDEINAELEKIRVEF